MLLAALASRAVAGVPVYCGLTRRILPSFSRFSTNQPHYQSLLLTASQSADTKIKAERSSYQHYSGALRHDICQEAPLRGLASSSGIYPSQIKAALARRRAAAPLEGTFVAARRQLMAPFPSTRGKKQQQHGEVQTYHTRSFGCGGEEGKAGSGVPGCFFFAITT